MRLRLPWLSLALLISTWASPSSLFAQAWLEDRQRTEGRGIRAGNFEIHPGIGAEGGYDSNVFLAAGADEDEPEQASGVARLAPHLYISTREIEDGPPPAIKLRAGVNGNGRFYFCDGCGFSLGVGQDLDFVINPERPFSFQIRERYSLSQDAFTEPAGPGSGTTLADIDLSDFTRHQFAAGPYIKLSTPGGLLNGGVGYEYALDFFTDDQFSGNDTQTHTALANMAYEFLPKTALFWDASLAFPSYQNPRTNLGVERNDARLYSSMLGLNGGLTSKLSFTLAAGYAAGIYDDNDDAEDVLAQAELRWRPELHILFTAGYERDLNNAFQGNHATLNRIKARSSMMFGGVFLLALRADVTFVDYGRDDAIVARAAEADQQGFDISGVTADRSDLHLALNLSGEYRFADWLALTAEVGYLTNITDFVYPPLVGPDPMNMGETLLVSPGDAAEYQRIQAWLGVRAFL